jgi:cytochrome P450
MDAGFINAGFMESIVAGHFMTLSTMAAMRDEKVFEAPDTFDIF